MFPNRLLMFPNRLFMFPNRAQMSEPHPAPEQSGVTWVFVFGALYRAAYDALVVRHAPIPAWASQPPRSWNSQLSILVCFHALSFELFFARLLPVFAFCFCLLSVSFCLVCPFRCCVCFFCFFCLGVLRVFLFSFFPSSIFLLLLVSRLFACFFFFKQKTAYEILSGLVGSEMCIRDSIKSLFGNMRSLFGNIRVYSET